MPPKKMLDPFTYTTKFGVNKIFFKQINTFIHQGFLKFIKIDSKNISNIRKKVHFK